MNISSGGKYPSNALSNFAPHPFIFDRVEVAGMEGFLQSLKFKNPDMQKEVCKLVGRGAKYNGKGKNWQRDGVLYWRGKEILRNSDEYQDLLDRVYGAIFEQSQSFRKALMASGNATLTHSLGRNKPSETILTRSEFCKRLTKLRELHKNDKETNV